MFAMNGPETGCPGVGPAGIPVPGGPAGTDIGWVGGRPAGPDTWYTGGRPAGPDTGGDPIPPDVGWPDVGGPAGSETGVVAAAPCAWFPGPDTGAYGMGLAGRGGLVT